MFESLNTEKPELEKKPVINQPEPEHVKISHSPEATPPLESKSLTPLQAVVKERKKKHKILFRTIIAAIIVFVLGGFGYWVWQINTEPIFSILEDPTPIAQVEPINRPRKAEPAVEAQNQEALIKDQEFLESLENQDSDGDGLTDEDEINIWGTDPNDPDSDGDGFMDGEEITNGYNPLGEGELDGGSNWQPLTLENIGLEIFFPGLPEKKGEQSLIPGTDEYVVKEVYNYPNLETIRSLAEKEGAGEEVEAGPTYSLIHSTVPEGFKSIDPEVLFVLNLPRLSEPPDYREVIKNKETKIGDYPAIEYEYIDSDSFEIRGLLIFSDRDFIQIETWGEPAEIKYDNEINQFFNSLNIIE